MAPRNFQQAPASLAASEAKPELSVVQQPGEQPRYVYARPPATPGGPPQISSGVIPDTVKQPTAGDVETQRLRAKTDAAYPKANAAFRFAENKLDTLITDVAKLQKDPGIGGITGLVYGRTPAITDAARSAQADLNSLKARGTFNELAEMRIQSPTGGALGQVSNIENAKLEAAFAALDQVQSEKDFRNKLGKLLSQLKVSKSLIKQAFDEEYGYKQGTPSAAPAAPAAPDTTPVKDPYANLPRVTNNDDYRKLPSGAEFIGPDNTRRRKP
jgi:hypothetical protein